MQKTIWQFIFSSPKRALFFILTLAFYFGGRAYLYQYARNSFEPSIFYLVWVELVFTLVLFVNYVLIYSKYVRAYGIPKRKEK